MWLVVNYIDNTRDFEQFDVTPTLGKPRPWWKRVLKLGTVFSYAPTALGILSYLLRREND